MAKQYRTKLKSIYGGRSAAGRHEYKPDDILKGMTPKQHCEKLIAQRGEGRFEKVSEHEDVCYLLGGNYFGTSVGAEYSYYYEVCTEIAFTGTLNDKATNIKELASLKGGERVVITANQKVTWTATNEKTLIKVAKNETTYSFTAPKSGTFTITAKGVCDPKASKSVSVKVVEQKPANDKPFDKELFIKELYLAMKEFGITQPNDMAGFLANVEHETGGFNKLTEGEGLKYRFSTWKGINSNTKNWTKQQGVNAEVEFNKLSEKEKINIMYKNMNGNTESDDGWTYRGRGAIQLTGRANYQAFANHIKRPDIMKNPELIAKDMNLAARSSAWFWKKHSQASKKALNGDFEGARKVVNGGNHGMKEVLLLTQKYLKNQGGTLLPKM